MSYLLLRSREAMPCVTQREVMASARRYYSGRNVERALDIEELRRMARRRLPSFVREYVEAGAEDEATLSRNRLAFGDHLWVHRAAVNVATISLSTTIFDAPAALPLAIGPTGFNGMLWKHGDVALARAAKAHGIPFTVSTVSSDSLDMIAKEAGGRLWFQLFVLNDPATIETLISRADHAGCEALVITLDAPILGNRTWNDRSYVKPMKLSFRSKLDVLLHVRWLLGVFMPHGLPGFGNLSEFRNVCDCGVRLFHNLLL